MTKNLFYLLLFFFSISTINFAQQSGDSIQKTKITIPEIEKVYLHTDNNYYTIGASLWYKAYSVYAYTNQLFDHSKILYVELISPESKIISRNITNLEGGLGHGDFILADSLGIKPGTYQLRAYTNWMRNYGDDFIFKKEIQIISPNKDNAILSKENDKTKTIVKNKKDNSEVEDPAAVLFDFFPEGGSLLEGVISNVAFKATDSFGNPIEIKGTVFDTTDKPITLFKSIHDGMGKFILQPEKDQKYYAIVITPNNEQLKIKLPDVQKTGYTLSINTIDQKKVVTIKSNTATLSQNPGADLTLVCTTRGITYFEGTQPLKDTKLSFILPEENFPEGIAQITLYDKLSIPQSERLVYIEKNNDITVSLSTDKKQYFPKEKVNLNLLAKDKQGNPLIANFSIAATDTNGTDENFDSTSNICSYFLMASDIRGKVHKPNYYFNNSNPARLFHLDLLLLTQGWRDFVWKKFPNLNKSQNFKVEKGITGKVENLIGTTAKENNQVQMILLNNKATAMLNDTTDVNGKFEFNNIVFKGNATLLLNTKNQKGKNSGEFVLDSIYNSPVAVDFKAFKPLDEEENQITQLTTNIRNKNILFNIPEENQLKDVIITAKKKKEDATESRYGFADFTYIPEEKGPRFSNIFMLLQMTIPNVTATANSVRFNRYNGPPVILVDGIETDMDLLSSISIDDIAKIEAIKGPGAAIFGSQGANGAIIIYTKLGKVNTTSKKVFHSIAMPVYGYQNTRFFYSPDYSKPNSLEKDKADIRNTLYWNPYLQPDEKGSSTISFYNNEVDTTVTIDLEGITNNGIPVVVKNSYQIKK